MTHPLQQPLTDTPVFASMLNDPRFGELATELLYPVDLSTHHTSFPRHSRMADMNHPLNCPGCSTASLEFQMTNPTPPRNDRHLALPPASSTSAERLQSARVARPKRTRSQRGTN